MISGGKKLLNAKVCFDFIYKLLSETFLILRGIQLHIIIKVQSGAKRMHVFESACDFFLWGYLKSKVYIRKPHTIDDLKVSIRQEIATIPQEMIVNVMQNFEERLWTCVRQEGRHLSDIIFRN